jgi:transcriptional regulator with XRE-family HTH domain
MRAEGAPRASAATRRDDAAAWIRFAQNIERWRRERDLTVGRLAARSELGPDRLAEILEAKDEPRYGEIAMLCGALGVDADQLFDGIRWVPPSDGGEGFEIVEDFRAEPPEGQGRP